MNRLITAAMASAFIFAATSTDVLAGETWLCESESGNMYRSEENARPGFCFQPEDEKSKTKQQRASKRFCESTKEASCKADGADPEVGTLRGIDFKLYEDGRGEVAGTSGADDYGRASTWIISCRRDKMTSEKHCLIRKNELHAMVDSSGGLFLSVGSEHFPSNATSIKVGARRFDTTDHHGFFNNGRQIISLMKDGVPIVTRYMKWPHRSWIDDEYNIYGLQVAIQAAKWQLAHGNIE